MIRDQRMQELVAKDREPITPFVDRVRQLWEERGVSTVLVMGGSGDYSLAPRRPDYPSALLEAWKAAGVGQGGS